MAKPPGEVTILDVVNAVGELERIRHCPLGLPSHTTLCPLHRELDKVYAAVQEALAKVTIAELNRSADPIIPLCDVFGPAAPG
jgi:DNA-binding IscR family transcriptional regulator